jgi:hypothetical protein
MLILAVWLFFGIVAALIGQRKGEGCLGFIVGVLFGPFGLLFVIFSSGNRMACSACREKIHKDASICPHCRTGVTR